MDLSNIACYKGGEVSPLWAYICPISRAQNTRIRHKITHYFWISLEKFVEDIKQSVQKPNGYLSKLEAEPTLKKKVDDAVWDMFSPHG